MEKNWGDTPSATLKIVRKSAYFNLFILSANIERQDSYCDYIHISHIYIAGRNINLVAKSHYTSEFKIKRKI